MQLRPLPYDVADGAVNMATDEVLVRSTGATASLRFYGWSSATVSLGYFQSHAIHRTNPNLSPLPWVRRPSGGATLVHHHELTYALALPANAIRQTDEPWMLRMHRVIVAALADLGLAGKVELVEGKPIKHGEMLCFQQFTVGDVLCAGKKIVGSAQRKYRQALLQHGSILLAQSEHTPSLPGIRELAGVALTPSQVRDAVLARCERELGLNVESAAWTEEEKSLIEKLAAERYGTSAWNERR